MSTNFLRKKAHKVRNKLIGFSQYLRIAKYRILSSDVDIIGNPVVLQPLLTYGEGKISFGDSVTLGYYPSPYFYSGYIYLDVRKKESTITVGDNVYINNNCSFISDGAGIQIGNNVLIGSNVEIIDSDFHDIDPQKRFGGRPKIAQVHIADNVFIGSNAKILKGVEIGENSVIANSAVVTSSIPANVIAGGNPAKIIKQL